MPVFTRKLRNRNTMLIALLLIALGNSDKIALGIGSLIIGFVLWLGGYDGALEQQTEAAKGAIQFGFAGLPALLGILGVVCIIFYRLDSRLKEIGQ